MKNVLKNLALVVFAVALSLVVAEVLLRLDGRYHNLASQVLVSSPAIWDRPANASIIVEHKDLNVPVEDIFDSDGVLNHSETSTRDKRNIVGFFGDSLTENFRIEEKFRFTSILDAAARPRARAVNYGVEGYGLDQSYLRYKKYEKHDITDVVYVFCENDLRNLYETALTEVTQDGDIEFIPSIRPFYQFIGRYHITYLIVSAYLKVRMLADFIRTGTWDWISVNAWSIWVFEKFSETQLRILDQYAESIATDFLSADPSARTLRLSQKFLVLLEKWKREVEASQRTFSVLVLPVSDWSVRRAGSGRIDDALARKLLRDFDGNVVYSIGFFKNCEDCRFQKDPHHFNEYGNAKLAEFILSNEGGLPFQERFKMTSIAQLRTEIDEYYNRLGR